MAGGARQGPGRAAGLISISLLIQVTSSLSGQGQGLINSTEVGPDLDQVPGVLADAMCEVIPVTSFLSASTQAQNAQLAQQVLADVPN